MYFSNVQQVIPVIKQVDCFKEYVRRIEEAVGKERAGELIKKALFVISAGTNDYVLNYYGPPIRSHTYTISAYHQFLVQIIQQFIQVGSSYYIHNPHISKYLRNSYFQLKFNQSSHIYMCLWICIPNGKLNHINGGRTCIQVMIIETWQAASSGQAGWMII